MRWAESHPSLQTRRSLIMTVVTISRELGSEGSLIAEEVAKGLGYHLADETTVATILKGYGLVDFEQEYQSIPGFWDRLSTEKSDERENFLTMLNRTLLALAGHGDVVIVGRGGFAVLDGMPGVFNVRTQAPLSLRIERTQDSTASVEPHKAEALVKGNDQVQKVFVKSVYGMQWNSAEAFDLVIGTGQIGADLAASMIVKAVQALRPEPPATAPSFPVDDILASAVQDALDCHRNHL
jgi:cytidylate kinase